MSEENKFGPKNNWTRIFRKKWFFPSLYLILAALLISAVVWYQSTGTEQADIVEDIDQVGTEDAIPVSGESGLEEDVVEEEEVIRMPVENEADAVIVTKFFDYDGDETEQANALIHYNNRYYQSTGIAIGNKDEESFPVVAAISGTVEEVKEDPLMGNVVVLAHADDVTTYYASLTDVQVKEGDEVEQGDPLGVAGKNIFGKENGTHVHFEMEKANVKMNPEAYFHEPVASLEVPEEEDEAQQPEEEIEAETVDEEALPEHTPYAGEESEEEADADLEEDQESEETEE